MPVPGSIAAAAVSFKYNADFLKKNLEGLTDEEWVRRPDGCCQSHLVDRGPCDLGSQRLAQAAG
jgi:hypothetical protein